MPIQLSIIIPVFNEADNIPPLVRELTQAMKTEEITYEIVLVDDASTDRTWDNIQSARQADPHVRGLKHTRNSGQSAALWTGIQATNTPLIATLDGDLQNDPADLPKLIGELKNADFICGVRTKRKDNFLKRFSSRVARMARKAILGVDFADTGCGFRVFKRSALTGIFGFNGLHRFLPVLVHGAGVTTREVPINHRPRTAGVSKYGLWNRLGRGILDLFAMAWYQRRRIGAIPYSDTAEPGARTKN